MAFTHVLVPTDFSDPAHQALRCALEEAALHHAHVTLLHVLPPHTETQVYYITGAPGGTPDFDPVLGGRLPTPVALPPTVVRQDPIAEALIHLHDLMPATFQGSWEVAVAAGHPAETIVRIAQERTVDLIVMGTHGRTGLSHVFLGSVAEHVVQRAPCAVLTVRHKARAEET